MIINRHWGHVCCMKTIIRWREITQTAKRPKRDFCPSRQSWAGHLAIHQDRFDTTQPLGGVTILDLEVSLHVH